MPQLNVLSLAASVDGGQQVYERAVLGRIANLLGVDWTVRSQTVRTLRAPGRGGTRVPARALYSAGIPRRLAGAQLAARADLVHRMDLRLPPAPRRETVTVHDVVSWRFPDEAAPPRSVYAEVKAAARVVCPSQFSADEVARTFGVAAPMVIPNGVEPEFFAATPANHHQLASRGIRAPFVLHSGGASLRKNLPALAEAWSIVNRRLPDVQLVLAGPPHHTRDRLFGRSASAVVVGRLPFADIVAVMAAASAVVVPSLYEGFGLPVLEAMAVGVPVVASNRSALPEVAGSSAFLTDPTGPDLAECLLEVLAGGRHVDYRVTAGRARAATFSWDTSAKAHAELWSSLC